MVLLVFWNVRGACNSQFAQNIRVLCQLKQPDLLLLVETKCEADDHFHCLASLGFDGIAWIPSVGRSGGIVAVWKKEKIDVVVVSKERQFIHLKCSGEGNQLSYITAVYAIPSSSQKQRLWTEICNFVSSTLAPWALIGDFNDVTSAMERTGGSGNNLTVWPCSLIVFISASL
ncbi:hypothetical protein K1719_029712 [Acacia pycnantha]|nr:hypothetical protein K1719_029712 [Acacia pycnantha]